MGAGHFAYLEYNFLSTQGYYGNITLHLANRGATGQGRQTGQMYTHTQIWRAIDQIAGQNNLSVSALAKLSGLDATAFNKSKRITPKGRERWPTSESIAKLLRATGTSLEAFAGLVQGSGSAGGYEFCVPLIGLAQAGDGGFFDDAGFPAGGSWEEIGFPGVKDENAYALEISGDSMEPVYRDGDIILVSPNSQARRGDRVVAKTRDGEVLAKILQRHTALTVELASFNPAHQTRTFAPQDLEWIARILWASQ